MKEAKAVTPTPGQLSPSRALLALVAGACLTTAGMNTAGATPLHVASSTKGSAVVLSHATDLGPVNPASSIDLTVWLKLRGRAGLNRTLMEQHTSGAPWLSEEQIEQAHAPAATNVEAVSAFLTAQGLTVTGVGPHNLYVKATGTAETVDSAFQVALHEYTLRGMTFRASSMKPTLPARLAPVVASVGGLSDLGAKPMIARPTRGSANTNIVAPNDGEGLPAMPVPLSGAGANGLFFSAQCFYPPTTLSFSSSSATASYSGGVYGASINNTAIGNLPPCGYQPSDMQTAYNLTPLYKAGLDGTGETIAIVDAFGSTTIQADLATFSAAMGLPPANLTVIGTPTESNFSTDRAAGWATETTLDVEWVHAIAPGAKILLVIAPNNSFDNLFTAIATAVQQPGVVSISNSWSGEESFTDAPLRAAADSILKLAGAKGISVNFASGDSGNEAINLGYLDVNYPASSPYATGVGGVSVALDQNKHILFQTAWGNNITRVAGPIAGGSAPDDPPINEGFLYGGGGGVSNVYPLPPFQAFLGIWGPRRLVPDISWVADPYTGVEFIFTGDSAGHQFIGTIGGTSLATPMFSALWGIAAQKAKRPLGQAAPLLYTLPPGAITDVVAPFSFTNATGTLVDANGTQKLSPSELALPLQGQPTFLSALYNSPYSTSWFVLSFGTDSSLPTTPGWDPATGLGTPNGWAFVNALGGFGGFGGFGY
jgi:subtilase family serine protease